MSLQTKTLINYVVDDRNKKLSLRLFIEGNIISSRQTERKIEKFFFHHAIRFHPFNLKFATRCNWIRKRHHQTGRDIHEEEAKAILLQRVSFSFFFSVSMSFSSSLITTKFVCANFVEFLLAFNEFCVNWMKLLFSLSTKRTTRFSRSYFCSLRVCVRPKKFFFFCIDREF